MNPTRKNSNADALADLRDKYTNGKDAHLVMPSLAEIDHTTESYRRPVAMSPDDDAVPLPSRPSKTNKTGDELFCEKHNLAEPAYAHTDDPHCPLCREEQRIEAERNEMLARRANPRMHPTVDAPRW